MAKLRGPYTRPFDTGFDWRLLLLSIGGGLAVGVGAWFVFLA